MITWQRVEYGECSDMSEVPIRANILTVDDVEVVAKCENCGKLIMYPDVFHVDAEGMEFCQECWEMLLEIE